MAVTWDFLSFDNTVHAEENIHQEGSPKQSIPQFKKKTEHIRNIMNVYIS
jgi:hypothetical protein